MINVDKSFEKYAQAVVKEKTRLEWSIWEIYEELLKDPLPKNSSYILGPNPKDAPDCLNRIRMMMKSVLHDLEATIRECEFFKQECSEKSQNPPH